MSAAVPVRKFWWFNALKMASALTAPMDTIEDLQTHSTSFAEGELSRAAFTLADPIHWLDEAFCCLVLLILPGCFMWMIPLAFYIPYALVTGAFASLAWLGASFAVVLAILYVSFVAYPAHFVPKLFAYFSLHVVWEDGYAPDTHSILFAPPHGVFPYGSLLVILMYRLFLRNPILGAAANIVFYLPISRQFFQWVGVVPATSQAITAVLDSNRPMAVSPGGIAEIFLAGHEHETIVMAKRKGLVRIALKTGKQLVPCYIFGNTSLYAMYSGGEDGVLQRVSRMLRMGVLYFWGRFYCPIAFRTPLLMAFGRPIDVVKVEEPSEEQVSALHALLMERVKHVYDTHRESYGWDHRDLVIQ